MKKHLLPNTGCFYKANLHMHTTVSDGEMSPAEVKKAYMEQGYSVVAFTDHEVMVPHPELTDRNFLAITATEISTNHRYDCDFSYCKTYHLNIYSPDARKSSFNTFDRSKIWLDHSLDYMAPEQNDIGCRRIYSVADMNGIIKKANSEGCLVSYNHPVWSLQDYGDYIDLKGLWGIEVYNTGCVRAGYLDSPKPLDDLLRRGERVMPLATDDAHRRADCFGGFTMINAPELSYESIFRALRNGDFYASTGPRLHEISIENGVVRVVSSPASSICISTDCRQRYIRKADGQPMTGASFDINGYLRLAGDGISPHPYIRVTVTDERGNAAYSRAYFMDELLG